MLNEESTERIDALQLSNNTVSRPIKDISIKIDAGLINPLELCSKYAL